MIGISSVHASVDLGFAREDGGQPGAFLEFANSARAMAMAGASTAVSDDSSATLSNPAALTQVQRKDLIASYSALFDDTTFSVINYAQPTTDWGTFGFGLVTLQSKRYEGRDEFGFQDGSFSTGEQAFLLSHGFGLSDRLSLGSSLKIIRESVDTVSSTGYGFDGAAFYRVTPLLNAGITLKNVLAPRLKLREEADRYPLDLRAGVRWQALKKMMLALDLDKTAGRSVKLRLGTEWAFNNLFVLRGGISETELTTGAGFKFNDWSIDYAFGYHDAVGGLKDLGSSHRVGLHWNFGKKIFEQQASARWQRRGQTYLATLRQRMNEVNPVLDEPLQKTIAGTRQVIRRQGYPKAEDLYAAQGYISFFEGEYDRSVQSLGEASVLLPADAELAQHLDKAKAQMTEERTREVVAFELKRVKELYEKGDFRGAVKSCEKILSLRPDNIEATTYLEDARKRIREPIERETKIARAKFDRGEYLDAIKGFQQVKELDPENVEATECIAASIVALEDEASKVETVKKPAGRTVLEVEPDSDGSRALYSQGLIVYSQGKIQEAAALWEKAVQLDTNNAMARSAFNRAQVELREKQ